MMYDKVVYLSRPFGKVVFSCSDAKYFKLFSKNLVYSFDILHSFDCIHFHVINPDKETFSKLKEYNKKFKNFTASYEYLDIKTLKKTIYKAKVGWLKELPSPILKMLALEQVRKKKILRKIIKAALFIGVPPLFIISKKWLCIDSQRVYYATRRFSLIADFFKEINELLVIDIDSIFKNDLFSEKIKKSQKVLLLKRNDSWSKHLAGFVYYPNNKESAVFIDQYAKKLIKFIESGNIFWGLDQYLFDIISTKESTSGLSKSVFGLNDDCKYSFVSYKGVVKYENTKS